jgi:putative DNA methylase
MSRRRLPPRSLLDAGVLPVGEIARMAKRESVRPRDAYQAHKWFARRLAATARSLLVGSTTVGDGNFWKAYYGEASCEGLTVLDPFMGGGVMLLEAARLGANVHGVDVEPVAAAISDFQGRLARLPDLQPHLDHLIATVGAEMAPYYRSFDDEGQEEILLHAFWVQRVTCGGCGHAYDAHPTFRLAWDEAKGRQWVACRDCSQVTQVPLRWGTFTCGCGRKTKADGGHVVTGTACCPACGHRERLIDLAKRTGKPPAFRLFAVETVPAGPEKRHVGDARRIRSATPRDVEIFAAAKRRLAREVKANPGFLVAGDIPRENRFDNRLVQYGYSAYRELFNARQNLHLGLLARALDGIEGLAGEALRIAFSDHLSTNNVLCGYAGGWRRLSPLFSIRAYRHIARPVELNPWLTKNGRGTFPNAVRSVLRASRSITGSVEPSPDGEAIPVPTRVAGSWDVRCGDAANLAHIPARSVDLVLTDPPYFDYIAYSELGHFYVPWMARLGLIGDACLNGFPQGQLASLKGTAEAADLFAGELARRLREVVRVCRLGARIVFTYQNLDVRGWVALAKALAVAGIRPVRAWPMFGDGGSSLHKHVNSISWDCVLQCKIASCDLVLAFDERAEAAGERFLKEWRNKLKETGHSLSAGDEANFRHAGKVVGAFRYVAPTAILEMT